MRYAEIVGQAIANGPIAIGIDLLIKSSVVIATAYLGYRLLPRSPIVRTAIWNTLLVALIVLPVAFWIAPRWRIACLPVLDQTPEMTAATELESIDIPLPNPFEMANESMGSSTSDPAATAVPAPIVRESLQPPETSSPTTSGAWWSNSLVKSIDGLLTLYLFIIAILMARLVISLFALSRWLRRLHRVDDASWIAALDDCRARLNISKTVALLQSSKVSVPVVVGWQSPTVVLPETLVDSSHSYVIHSVLLHELSHVRRHDYAWNVLASIIGIVYWPNPFYRLIAPLIRDDRERACDDICIHYLGDRRIYQATLVDIASRRNQKAEHPLSLGLGLALAMAQSSSKLAGRLSWIAESRGSSRCFPHGLARIAIVTTMVLLASAIGSIDPTRAESPATIETDDQKPQGDGHSLKLKVVNATTGKPVPRASIDLQIDWDRTRHLTDDQGTFTIRHSTNLFDQSISVYVSAEGLAQQSHRWGGNPTTPIPPEATISLLPGQRLGGVVRDEQGKPIEGATVMLSGYGVQQKDPHESLWNLRAITDRQGNWETRSAPALKGGLSGIRLIHPDFVSDLTYTDPPSIADLRAGKGISVMKKGTAVSGRVVDHQGHPVKGARMTAAYNQQAHYHEDELLIKNTDDEGRFQYPQVKPGPLFMIAQAAGHGPETTELTVGDSPIAKVIRLNKRAAFQGRILDTTGNPLRDVLVFPDFWRRYRFFGVHLSTDAEGRFEWIDGPDVDEEVTFEISKPGYSYVDWLRLRPNAQETPIVMRRELHISGRLRDPETQKAVDAPRFEAMLKIEVGRSGLNDKAIKWTETDPILSPFWDFGVDAETPGWFQFRVRAEGYEPFVTRKFRYDEGLVKYDIALRKQNSRPGRGLAGRVLQPDGRPLAKAQVIYVRHDRNHLLEMVEMTNGKLVNEDFKQTVVTDAEGRFEVPNLAPGSGEMGVLLVSHDQFYGEAALQEFRGNGSVIHAKRWGTIQGKVLIRNKPAADTKINGVAHVLGSTLDFDTQLSNTTTTDSEGNFKLDRAVPGSLLVRVMPDPEKGPAVYGPSHQVDVKEGEVAVVKMGGAGRPVIAQIHLPSDFQVRRDPSFYSLYTKYEHVNPPLEVAKGDQAAYERWWRAWTQTPEGIAYQKRQVRYFGMGYPDDGKIRIDDVLPGDYFLQLAIVGQRSGPLLLNKKVTVPPIADEWTDESLDLGIIEPKPVPVPPNPGEFAPAFEAKSLKGEPIKLEQFRGKILLLTGWFGKDDTFKVGDLPHLQAVFKKYGQDPKFAMLSLDTSGFPELTEEFRKLNPFPGLHGSIDGDSGSTFQEEYLRRVGRPAIFLIGPDGKFIAAGLRGRGIVEAVDKAFSGKK